MLNQLSHWCAALPLTCGRHMGASLNGDWSCPLQSETPSVFSPKPTLKGRGGRERHLSAMPLFFAGQPDAQPTESPVRGFTTDLWKTHGSLIKRGLKLPTSVWNAIRLLAQTHFKAAWRARETLVRHVPFFARRVLARRQITLRLLSTCDTRSNNRGS